MAPTGEPTLTHALLAKALGVTATTIKSYRRKFPEFWRTESLGKPIRFPAESLDLCRSIHHHFRRGLSIEETRIRLGQEFEAAPPIPASPQPSGETARQPVAPVGPAESQSPTLCGQSSLGRIEDLLAGLFSLQNRTHSLLTELLAKLDTVADRLGQTREATGAAGAAPPTPAGSAAMAKHGSPPRPAAPAPQAAAVSGRMAPQANSDAARIGFKSADTRLTGQPDPKTPSNGSVPRPPAQFLGMPVVVLSANGDFLGVTSPMGRPFTLEQFEAFLIRRAEVSGGFSSAWVRQGQQWSLRLEGKHAHGETHEHHFLQAVTPKGNTVARFASLSVNGKPASDAALQAFLRQVKESLTP